MGDSLSPEGEADLAGLVEAKGAGKPRLLHARGTARSSAWIVDHI